MVSLATESNPFPVNKTWFFRGDFHQLFIFTLTKKKKNVKQFFYLQNFLGFGQSAEIDIVFDGAENRKLAEVKTDDGKKEKYLLYYDGEAVSGKVSGVRHTGICLFVTEILSR